ncbi:MAG: hypothetical protein AAGF11_39545 [Myxococcota bacterium]
MTLSLGCDPTDSDELRKVEDLGAALELSPNQDLVDIEGSDAVAFDSIESFDIKAETQPLESGCTLLRPASWYGPGITCAEYFKAPGGLLDTLPMSNGQSFITNAGYTFPGPGTGHARISCNNGNISIQALSCQGGLPQ